MAIRFKFRSSIQFDSVEIENRPSISVRDLRLKIVRHKHLNSCQDFDLAFSDAVTGEEYVDENFQIPSGSSIIIKRVPAGLVHSALGVCSDIMEEFKVKNTKVVDTTEPAKIDEMDDFGDFGVEWGPVPVPEVISFDYKPHSEKRDCTGGGDITNDTVLRLQNMDVPLLRCQLLQESDVSEACPKDIGAHPVAELHPSAEEHLEADKRVVVTNHPSTHTRELPSELRCSICDTYFKEAVMIPCCQHSFCKRCIHTVLVDKARCPKCSSTKCKVEDLLPNVCLSQAIDRFLVSQSHPSCSDDVILGDAPDGESGIQACSHVTDSRCKHLGPSKYMKSANLKVEEGGGFTLHVDVKEEPQADFQGENQPIFSQTPASTSKRKKELRLNFSGRDGNFVENGRYEKVYFQGDRTCYKCGSPNHFLRDCPAASNPHLMLASGHAIFPGAMPGGYASPYYNGAPLPHISPLAIPYYSPRMMSFNGAMVPGSPFALSPHMASVYGGAPFFGGYMRMGPLAPHTEINAERPVSHSVIDSFQERRQLRKHSDENIVRKQYCDNEDSGFNASHNHNETERSYYKKSYRKVEKSLSRSEDSFSQKSQRKSHCHKHRKDNFLSTDKSHQKDSRSISGGDRRSYHLERSSSIVEDRSIFSNGCTEDSKHHHRHRGYKRHTERTPHCSSDSSRSLHKRTGDRSVTKYEVDFNGKRHNEKHGNLFKSAMVAVVSNDKKDNFDCKDSRHKKKDKPKRLIHDRWQMIVVSDDDYREEDHHYKRKKVY